jgi:hypothetical protein
MAQYLMCTGNHKVCTATTRQDSHRCPGAKYNAEDDVSAEEQFHWKMILENDPAAREKRMV